MLNGVNMFLRNTLKHSLDQCFSSFFMAYNYHNTKHVQAPKFLANSNAYIQDTGLPGCFAGWHV